MNCKAYIIDRDEREIGGELIRVGTYASWKEARLAWRSTKRDPRKDVTMFFGREEFSDSCTTIACK